jgi:hypothetical protein
MNGAKPGASSGQPAGPSGARLVRAKAAIFVLHGRGGSAQGMLSPAEVSAQPTRVVRPWTEHDNQMWRRLSALAKCALRYYRYCSGHKMSAGR